jgi:hypothetical protein
LGGRFIRGDRIVGLHRIIFTMFWVVTWTRM